MNRLLIVAISFGIMFAFWSFLQLQSQKGSFTKISDQYDRAIPLFETTEELVRNCQSKVANADSSLIDTLSGSDSDDSWGQMEASRTNRSQAGNGDLMPDNVVVCSAAWDGKQKSLEQVMRFVFEIKAQPIEMKLESVQCTAITNSGLNASTTESWNCQVTATYLSEAQSNAKTSKIP